MGLVVREDSIIGRLVKLRNEELSKKRTAEQPKIIERLDWDFLYRANMEEVYHFMLQEGFASEDAARVGELILRFKTAQYLESIANELRRTAR